ncbi:MAG: sugar kinase [Hyphomicrobiaceae bacterium]
MLSQTAYRIPMGLPQREINRDMSLPSTRIVSVGECMVELARADDGRFQLSYGGDTFNSAVYMARLGAQTRYLTALGNDPYSHGIIALGEQEGVDMTATRMLEGRMPGLYVIETEHGERSFWYWRDTSPARELFGAELASSSIDCLQTADLIYFSGITLSLFGTDGRQIFLKALQDAKSRGARIAMDSNFRPRGWPANRRVAQDAYAAFWPLADLALPTFDDESLLWGESHPAQSIERLQTAGVPEICLKLGADGAHVASATFDGPVPSPKAVTAIDTTAAGDSFNAAYVCARLAGHEAAIAAAAGNRLAAIVVTHRGAITPKAALTGFQLSA